MEASDTNVATFHNQICTGCVSSCYYRVLTSIRHFCGRNDETMDIFLSLNCHPKDIRKENEQVISQGKAHSRSQYGVEAIIYLSPIWSSCPSFIHWT